MMSGVPSRRLFAFLPPATSPNSEKILVEAETLPVEAPASAWLDEQYGYIGGSHGGDVVKCLLAGNEELARTTKRQHALNRALVAICWHLARKVVDDDLEYEIIVDLPRWKNRHIKPKIDDDVATRCRFLALLLFSDETGQNDNGASKKGRVVTHLIQSGLTEESIVEHLSRIGGVGRVYEEALADVGAEDGRALPESSARPRRTTPARKSVSSDAPAERASGDPVQILKSLAAGEASCIDGEPSIIIADLGNHAMFAGTNLNDELQLTVKRIDRGGDCFVFRVSGARPANESE